MFERARNAMVWKTSNRHGILNVRVNSQPQSGNSRHRSSPSQRTSPRHQPCMSWRRRRVTSPPLACTEMMTYTPGSMLSKTRPRLTPSPHPGTGCRYVRAAGYQAGSCPNHRPWTSAACVKVGLWLERCSCTRGPLAAILPYLIFRRVTPAPGVTSSRTSVVE